MKVYKKGLIKRLFCIVLTFAMVLTMMPGMTIEAEAAAASSEYTTDANGLMEYKAMSDNVYDFMGYINSGWRQVTFGNYGFSIGAYNGSGLSITSSPEFISDGKAIRVTYKVKNTSSQAVSNYRFFIAADTMIDGNDASTNTIEDDVVVMTNERTGISFFALSSTEGGTAVATEYSSATVSYGAVKRGADPSTVTSVASARDSAFVMYFPKETISAGATKEYTLIVGMGDVRSIGNIIEQVKNSLNAALDYGKERLTDLTPGGTYEVRIDGDGSGTVYSFIADGEGTIPLTGKDQNEQDYNFIGKKLVMVHKGDGTTTDSDPVAVHIAARPAEPAKLEVPRNLPSDIDITGVETTPTSIKVRANEGQEYRIESYGSWLSPGAGGYVTFSGLNPFTEYTIYTRFKATPSTPASPASDGAAVRTLGMFSPTKIEYNGPFDGLYHELKVNANVEGAVVTYSQNLEGPYTSEPFSFRTSGEHKIYYCITKENYYNAYGALTANIAYNLAAAKATAKEIIDEEVGVDRSDLVTAAANAAKATIDAATTMDAVERATDDGIAAIIAARAAHILAEEKAAAKDIIDAEVDGDTAENVLAAANAAKTAIDAAPNSAAVITATSNGIAAINAVKEANILATAKAKAIEDIDAEAGENPSEDVKAAADAAKAAINNATRVEDVVEETVKGIAAIATIKGEVALAVAKQAAIDIIDVEAAGDTSERVTAAVNTAKEAINNATTIEDVVAATDAGIEAIKEAKLANALEAAKKAAEADIDAEAGADTSEEVAELIREAKEKINAATTLEDIAKETAHYMEAIEVAEEAHALAEAKASAKAEIDAEVGTDTSENVLAAAKAIKDAIDAATTPSAVLKLIVNGVEAVEAAKARNEALVLPDTEVVTETVPKTEQNEITNITPLVKGNDFGIVLDSENLKDAIELTPIEEGFGVWVWLEVNDVTDTVNAADEQVISANVKDATIGAYINIDLFKQIAGQAKTQITETVEPVKLSITIPDSIADSNRVYAIVRVHDGVYEQITDFTKMKEGNIVDFTSDRFSTYAIVYKEANIVTVPATSDTNSFAMYFIIMFGSMAFAFFTFKKINSWE